ncbi:hypothetical protein Tco_0750436 [Tanacetum coccineum]|uniref:Uncharacterized protein n=1 Tax=Tanacetum coccineum TaxID=301880 RepID=A0ABQ4Z1F8_9ASTR
MSQNLSQQVASLKSRSIDKGRRYKRIKETKGKKVVSSLDFQEVDAGAKKVNTVGEINAAGEEVNTASKVNTGSIELNIVIEQDSTTGENKGQREGKAPMLSEETPKKSKEQILQEEASLAEAISQRIAEEEERLSKRRKEKLKVVKEHDLEVNFKEKILAKQGMVDLFGEELQQRLQKRTERRKKMMKAKGCESKKKSGKRRKRWQGKDWMDGPVDKLEKGFWKCVRIMVHCLNLESMDVYMLSERKYPYSASSLGNMISMKNEGTAKVFEGTEEVHEGMKEVQKVCCQVLKVPLVLSDILEHTACFIRYRLSFTDACSLSYLLAGGNGSCLNGIVEDLTI